MHALEAHQHTMLTYLDQIAQYQGVFISLTYYHISSHLFHFCSSLFLLSSHQSNNIYMYRGTLREYPPANKRGDTQLYQDRVQHQHTSSREHVMNPLISSCLIFSFPLPPSPSLSLSLPLPLPPLPLAFGCFSFYFSSSILLFIY